MSAFKCIDFEAGRPGWSSLLEAAVERTHERMHARTHFVSKPDTPEHNRRRPPSMAQRGIPLAVVVVVYWNSGLMRLRTRSVHSVLRECLRGARRRIINAFLIHLRVRKTAEWLARVRSKALQLKLSR